MSPHWFEAGFGVGFALGVLFLFGVQRAFARWEKLRLAADAERMLRGTRKPPPECGHDLLSMRFRFPKSAFGSVPITCKECEAEAADGGP